jgi:hypothetical protein
MKTTQVQTPKGEETAKQDLFKLSTLTLIIMIILSLLYMG